MSKYEKQAADFLQRHNLEFRAVLVGNDCPMFCEDAEKEREMDRVNTYPRKSHIHGKHYRCTFSGAGRGHLTIDFWNSYQDEEFNAYRFGQTAIPKDYPYWDKFRRDRHGKRRIPTPYDVLSCIEKSDPGNFEEFCDNFGYDTDSHKAEVTYHAVVREWKKIKKFFTPEELTEAQEIN